MMITVSRHTANLQQNRVFLFLRFIFLSIIFLSPAFLRSEFDTRLRAKPAPRIFAGSGSPKGNMPSVFYFVTSLDILVAVTLD